jgi:hypothetical protein
MTYCVSTNFDHKRVSSRIFKQEKEAENATDVFSVTIFTHSACVMFLGDSDREKIRQKKDIIGMLTVFGSLCTLEWRNP